MSLLSDEWNGNSLYKWCQAHKHELPNFDALCPVNNTDADYEAHAYLYYYIGKYSPMNATKIVHGEKNAYYACRKLAWKIDMKTRGMPIYREYNVGFCYKLVKNV